MKLIKTANITLQGKQQIAGGTEPEFKHGQQDQE